MNTLVIYFSETGTTKNRAQAIAAALGADLYEIRAQVPYTSRDRDWNDANSRCNREQYDASSRPAFAGDLPDVSRYERIIVGHPTWWGIPPRIVQTVLDQLDLSDKILGSFSTSGGSTYEKAQPIFDKIPAKEHLPGAVLNSDTSMQRWLAQWK